MTVRRHYPCYTWRGRGITHFSCTHPVRALSTALFYHRWLYSRTLLYYSFLFIQSTYFIHSSFFKVKDLFFHEWIWYDKKRIIYFPFKTSTVLNHVGWICLAQPCCKNFLLTTKFQQNLLYHGIPQQASLISCKRYWRTQNSYNYFVRNH